MERYVYGFKIKKEEMKKQLILIAFAFLLVVPLVQSAPPFVSSAPSGCIIAPVVRETLKAGQDFDFNFHVFNVSNGVPLSNSTLSCYFHFYNQTGDHVFSTILRNDPFSKHQVINEWTEMMNGGNISSVGTYAYLVQCNGTAANLGCADKGMFEVNKSGFAPSTTSWSVVFGLCAIMFLLLLSANLWNERQWIMKSSFLFLSMLMGLVVSQTLIKIGESDNAINLSSGLFISTNTLLITMIWLIISFLFIYMLVNIVRAVRDAKKQNINKSDYY